MKNQTFNFLQGNPGSNPIKKLILKKTRLVLNGLLFQISSLAKTGVSNYQGIYNYFSLF